MSSIFFYLKPLNFPFFNLNILGVYDEFGIWNNLQILDVKSLIDIW